MTLEKKYYQLLGNQGLYADDAQLALVRQLDQLTQDLQKKITSPLWPWRKQARKITGLYIYGSVGRGKTMLMDLFYENLARPDKIRVHFNEFMHNVQEQLEVERQFIKLGKTKNADPIVAVAAALAQQAKILCFDECCVTDIADAMILGRLFAQLFEHGVVLVTTSNVAPDDLYKNGLNRALFLPFIATLKNHVTLFNLDGPTDYRRGKVINQPLYLTPLVPEVAKQMDTAFADLTDAAPPISVQIEVRGHQINVPCASGKAARFDFSDLCAKPLGAHDYAVLAKKYHYFFIDNVPVFDNSMRNEAKRFILLIDTLYETKVKLFISAAAPPEALYRTPIATTESFEFQRTASRLYEMQSAEYSERT